MTRFNRRIWTILVGTLAGFALTACGGGGGGGGGVTTPSYSGVTTQAAIDASTAEPMVLDAYSGSNLGGSFSVTTLAVTDPAPAGQPLPIGTIIQDTTRSLDWVPQVSTLDAIPSQTGPCGGSYAGAVTQTGNIVNGHITYSGYCSEGEVLNGTLNFSGSVADTGEVTISMTTSGLTSTSGGQTDTLSGNVSLNFNVNQPSGPVTLSMNLLLVDGSTGKDYWIRNYQMTTTSGATGATVNISGRFYDFDLGYVDVSTTSDLLLDASGIPQSGSLHFAGSNNTYADLTALGGGGYELVVNGVVANPSGSF